MTYVLRLDGVERGIGSEEELEIAVNRFCERRQGEIWLLRSSARQGGRLERWLYRILGLSTKEQGPGVGAFVNERGAVLLFVDRDWNESVSIRGVADDQEDESVSFRMENGQQVLYRVGDIVDLALVTPTLREFLRSGGRPKSVQWRRSK